MALLKLLLSFCLLINSFKAAKAWNEHEGRLLNEVFGICILIFELLLIFSHVMVSLCHFIIKIQNMNE